MVQSHFTPPNDQLPSNVVDKDEFIPNKVTPESKVGKAMSQWKLPWLAYQAIVRGRRRILSRSALTEAVAPVIAALIALGIMSVSHFHPENVFVEAGIAVGIVGFTWLVLRAVFTLRMLDWIRLLNFMRRQSRDKDRDLFAGMISEQLEYLTAIVSDLLDGTFVPDPPESASGFLQTFFAGGGSSYIGVDSHLPSEYFARYQFFLDIHKAELSDRQRLDRRVIVATKEELANDYLAEDSRYVDFVRWHHENGVGLYWIPPEKANQIKEHHGVAVDSDIAIWPRYSVTFKTEPQDGQLILALSFAGEKEKEAQSWTRLLNSATEILSAAEVLSEDPPTIDVVDAELAGAWADYVNVKRRLKPDGKLATLLVDNITPGGSVFDAACGIGAESALLVKKDYSVVSNEIDINLAAAAEQLAIECYDVRLDLRRHLWQRLDESVRGKGNTRFDSVICLGNSLCLESDRGRRAEAVRNFKALLRSGGCLIIDERNFQYIRDHFESIAQSPDLFLGRTPDPMYGGQTVKGFPIGCEGDKVEWQLFKNAGAHQMESLDEIRGAACGKTLQLHGFAFGELFALLRQCGFTSIDCYADLEFVSSNEMPEWTSVEHNRFFTYVARVEPAKSGASK